MSRTSLALSLALALSVMLNVTLLRREPPAASPPGLRAPAPVVPPATAGRTADAETDAIFLREEVRKLREQLAIGRARRALERTVLHPGGDDTGDQPEAREFLEFSERVTSLVEMRESRGRDEQGRTVIHMRQVLTPDRRREAFRLLEEYAALDGTARTSFGDQLQTAVAAYYRIQEAFERDIAAARKAGDNDEFFEDAGARNQKIYDRMSRESQEWIRDHVQPLRTLLDRRDGIRPALLSHSLAQILMRLGTADER